MVEDAVIKGEEVGHRQRAARPYEIEQHVHHGLRAALDVAEARKSAVSQNAITVLKAQRSQPSEELLAANDRRWLSRIDIEDGI